MGADMWPNLGADLVGDLIGTSLFCLCLMFSKVQLLYVVLSGALGGRGAEGSDRKGLHMRARCAWARSFDSLRSPKMT